MNSVAFASSVTASSAGAFSGSPAGAPPAPGGSFDDVFRQLSGGDLGITEGDGTGEATSPTGGLGTSGVDEAPEVTTDVTTATGTTIVPVVLVLQTLPATPAVDVQSDPRPADGEGAVGAARTLERAGASAAWAGERAAGSARVGMRERAAAAIGAPVTAANTAATGDGLAALGTTHAAETSGTQAAAAADTDTDTHTAIDTESYTHTSADTGTDVETGTGSDTRGADQAVSSFTTATKVATDRFADRAEPVSERARARDIGAPGEPGRSIDARRRTQPAVAIATAGTSPDEAAAPSSAPVVAQVESAATIHLTSATGVPRVLGEPARASGVPRALAGAIEPSPAPRSLDASVTAALAVLADATSEPATVERALVSPEQAVAPLASAFHGPSALSAALRAFRQAGIPAEGQTQSASTIPSLTHAPTDGNGSPDLTVAGRLPGKAATVSDSVAAAVEPDRRVFSQPVMWTPSAGGELRVGSEVHLGPRVELAGLPVLADGADEPVHAQIVQSLRVQWAGGAGEARVRLRPEFLGEVVATIKVDQGTVTATLQADTPEVRRWMETHTQSLREGLVEHGLKLDRLVVLAEPTRGESADDRHGRPRGRHPQNPQPRPRRPRPDDANATFSLDT